MVFSIERRAFSFSELGDCLLLGGSCSFGACFDKRGVALLNRYKLMLCVIVGGNCAVLNVIDPAMHVDLARPKLCGYCRMGAQVVKLEQNILLGHSVEFRRRCLPMLGFLQFRQPRVNGRASLAHVAGRQVRQY